MTDKAQDQALQLANEYRLSMPQGVFQMWAADVVIELRRQHARIAELEAELKAVGAGGVQALSAGPEDMAKGGVGKSGFDYRTAADLIAGHAVSAAALSKFVQEARWAHGYKESYAAQNLELLHTIATRDAEIELLKKALMDAEAASPTPPAEQPAQPGAVYAELPEPALQSTQCDSTMRYSTLSSFSADQMRDFADRTHALRQAALQKKHNDFVETIGLMLAAVGYKEEYALQWPKEKASVTFKRWFDEQMQAAPKAEPGERCQHCINRSDGFYGSYAPPCPYHDDDGKPRAQPAPQQEVQEPTVVDLKTMELAESVGLIGPASRTHDLHAAIQRFHDLICTNATIKAAKMAADVIAAVKAEPLAVPETYPPLPMQFACSGVFVVYSADQMRAYVDADRAARAALVAPQAAPAVDEQMRKDAGRYRFLRDCDLDYMAEMYWPDGQVPTNERLDAAIDAALAAQGGTP